MKLHNGGIMRIYKCTECGESEYLRQYVWINPNDYMTCTKHNFVYEESIQKTPEIYCDCCKKSIDGLIWEKIKIEESEDE